MKSSEGVRLSPDQLLMCTHTVRGFSLKIKEWLHFEVDSIFDIKWNNTAFESLVLPEEYKRLILALAESQRTSSQVFDDFVRGKGKGIVMLLNGPPGVGKTLTAESVSEKMKVPLYSISAGDLGLDPGQVESRLLLVFKVARAWNAVVLLDEADIFLERRKLEDLFRNELVSIFLQHLEYFQGTLFLTTNRVEVFDPAFESRIHVSISYPELDYITRRQIWSAFLKQLSITNEDPLVLQNDKQGLKHEIEDEDLNTLSKEKVNGRQIKNIVKAAALLALQDKEVLKMEYVTTVLKIMKATPSVL